MQTAPVIPPAAPNQPLVDNSAIGKYRWTICSLVFFATTVN